MKALLSLALMAAAVRPHRPAGPTLQGSQPSHKMVRWRVKRRWPGVPVCVVVDDVGGWVPGLLGGLAGSAMDGLGG